MTSSPRPAPADRRGVFLAALEFGVHPLVAMEAAASVALDRDERPATPASPTTNRSEES